MGDRLAAETRDRNLYCAVHLSLSLYCKEGFLISDENVQIEITNDEALVLFEFLARFSETGTLEVVDQAEKEPFGIEL